MCGVAFAARASLQQKFCSRACANKSYERRITLQCQACGNEYAARAKSHAQKYCSRVCRTIGIGKTESYIERKFAAELTAAGMSFQAQHPIGPYVVDFAFVQHRIVIECDGDYWHSLPESVKRDRRKDLFLHNRGWRVLRFSERSINADLDECIHDVIECIASQLPFDLNDL